MSEIIHVTPAGDTHRHCHTTETFFGTREIICHCRCMPAITYNGDDTIIVVHNAFDGRANFEWDNKVRNN